MNIEKTRKIEELAKVIFKYHNRDQDWLKTSSIQISYYMERAEYIINAGYGLQPKISPHKIYEIAKGNPQVYRDLMMAHGYLMLKKTHCEIPSVNGMIEICVKYFNKKGYVYRQELYKNMVINAIHNFLTNAKTTS